MESDRTQLTPLRGRSGRFLGRLLFACLTLFAAAPVMAAVDLVVNNADTGSDPTPAGGIVTYTVRVDNNGSTGATGVKLADTLPAGTVYIGASAPAGVTCGTPAGGVLNCDLGSLASAGSITVSIQVRAPAAGIITNTASATSNEADTAPANNTGITQDTTINQGADLALAVAQSPSGSVTSGGALGYTFTVANNGPDTASSVRITANLPPGFNASSGLPSGCSVASQVLTCDLGGTIASGGNRVIGPINGTVAAAGGSDLALNGSVAVSSLSAPQDPDSGNNSVTTHISVLAGSDVSLTKTASTGSPILTGTAFSFILTPRYTGDNPTNVSVTDTVPANFQITGTPSGTGWSCGAPAGQTITCARPLGGSGAGYNIAMPAITVPVKAITAGTAITNTATASSTLTDPQSSNNAGSATVGVVDPTSDLSANKSGPNPALATVGSSFDWSISMHNNGTAPLTGTARMIDTLPVGVTLTAYKQTNGWSCTPAAPFTPTAGNQTVTCTRDYTAGAPLAVGGTSQSVLYTVTANTTGNLNNSMCVSAVASAAGTPWNDNDASNNCVGVGVDVQAGPDSADLKLVKTALQATTAAGDELDYTLEVVNSGPQTAVAVSVVDQLDTLINSSVGPTGAGFIAATIANGPAGANCPAPSATSGTGVKLQCALGDVPVCTAGSNCPVITVKIRPGGDGGARTNSAYALSPTTADPNYNDNNDSVTTTIDARADVSVVISGSPSPATAGQNLTYTLTVRNGNYSQAQNVSVSDLLPPGVTFVSATASGGGSCPATLAAGSTTGSGNQTLVCNWGAINQNAQQTVTVVVRPNDATQGTTLVNTATASTSTTELSGANNSGSFNAPVNNAALDILGNIVDSPDPVAVGDTMTYTLTLTNSGPSYAENANFTATLPTALLSFQSLSAPAGATCSTPAVGTIGGTITCQFGTVAAATSKSVQVTMRGEAKGTTTLKLSTSSDEVAAGLDTRPGNNNPSESTTVRTKADVQVVSKTANPSSIGYREPFNYTIVVANNGPGVADGVQVTDSLPSGMVLAGTPTVAANGGFPSMPGAPCTGVAGGTNFSCTLGDDVAVNANTAITVPVRVTGQPSANPATYTNNASITTSSQDPTPGNNSNSGNVSVTSSSVAGSVFADLNGNGVRDAGEAGIAGVTLKVTGTAVDGSAVNRTVTSGADGSYVVPFLPTGNYTVTETQPSGYRDGTDTAGSAGGTAANPGDAISGIALPSNTAATGYNFGELPDAQITGKVYSDLNNNGVADAGEAGIGNPPVTLTLTGTDDLGQAVSLTTTTDASGNYAFKGLRPGNYTVTETQPAGYLPGKARTGTGVTAGGTPSADGNTIAGITLGAGQQGANFDFGELASTSLAGFVYIDANKNGVRDAGETAGIGGVTVTLTGTDDLGHAVNTTVTTANDGSYSFPNLRPGSYQIAETQPAQWQDGGDAVGTVGGTPNGALAGNDVIGSITIGAGQSGIDYNFGEVGQGLGGFVYVDANGNGVRDAGETGIAGVSIAITNTATNATVNVTTDASGAYLASSLPGGTYRIAETQPPTYADGQEQVGTLGGTHAANDVFDGIVLGVSQVGANYNFGELAGRLSGATFIDGNNNGVRDAGETGIAGVTVTLTGTDVDGHSVNRTVSTDANGDYVFDGLLPSNGAGYTLTETQPGAYADGPEHVGSLGGTAGAAGASVISGIPVAPGARGTAYDFGELTGGISGSVYVDANNNGVRDAGEAPIAGVSVRLTGTDVDGKAVDRTVVTGADGNYVFAGLTKAGAAGYTITETQPDGYIDGKSVPGKINGAPCAACTTSTRNVDGNVPFDPAQPFTQFDFPELTPSSLAGSVYDDVNGNQVRDTGEGLGNVTVTLTGTDDLGQAVNLTATTAADGSYKFEHLRPGSYSVTETQPTGLGDVGSRAGTAGGSTTPNVISAIALAQGTAATGYDFIDHGSVLSGAVYFDKNGNGVRDAGEPGLGGVTVTLSGPITRTVTTDATGAYQFAGLVAGTYTVTEAQPPLYKDGGTQVGSAGGAKGNNSIGAITLGAGTNATDYNFPELTGADGSIAGSVWLNNATGNPTAKDTGEASLTGWYVELYQNGSRVASVPAVATDAQGNYVLTGVPAGSGYELRFRSPGGVYYGYPVSQDPDKQWNGTVNKSAAMPSIQGVTVGSGVAVTQQDLPLDPGGIVYDAVSRQPLAGARVTLLDPSGQPVNPQYLAGGQGNVTQTTGTDGLYQFLLLPGAPAGTYTLRVEAPAGYVTPPSGIHPPAGKQLSVPGGSTTYRVSPLNAPPASGDLPPYYLAFAVTANSVGFAGNHIPVDPVLQGALRVTKTTPKINVSKGDLVPYTIAITNTLAVTLTNIAAVDLVPAGFKYRAQSARIDGMPREPLSNGRTLSWPDLSIGPNQTRTLTLVLVIGSGVGEGEYTNQAWASNTLANRVVSNIGSAVVRLVPDPTFDCADLIGKVFDDKNGNGYQDQGEPGVPAVRLATPRGLLVTTDAEGRYHVPCADIPQYDRGANFVMKLDERSLPTGYRMTTENPGDVRMTAGKMSKLNFGVALHRVVRVDVSAAAFEHGGDRLLDTWAAQLPKLYERIKGQPTVLRLAYHPARGENLDQARQRLRTLQRRIDDDWHRTGDDRPVLIEQEIAEVQP
ncbi:SdrD B-like domain-containing protein [Dyella sp. BiH032]|uniref:SdrD B-like domain-containing protein n=1 Tax=Dyella sp. BiH032 TaxID=3075430 RepID=UPI00289313B1|nr:SdrD B-like domain-containing protein [Dyella sp. BiH032]WNL44395.1 SdrD B-like domain-containing protein [Dyella sp. BiH032]